MIFFLKDSIMSVLLLSFSTRFMDSPTIYLHFTTLTKQWKTKGETVRNFSRETNTSKIWQK